MTPKESRKQSFLHQWELKPNFLSFFRILHIYTAKGLREYAFAAAEKLCELGKLDSKEHKGKVNITTQDC